MKQRLIELEKRRDKLSNLIESTYDNIHCIKSKLQSYRKEDTLYPDIDKYLVNYSYLKNQPVCLDPEDIKRNTYSFERINHEVTKYYSTTIHSEEFKIRYAAVPANNPSYNNPDAFEYFSLDGWYDTDLVGCLEKFGAIITLSPELIKMTNELKKYRVVTTDEI